ncbi:DUF99 family protein [Halomarina ordinaria]|uniref:UPF0215 protein ACFQHK_11695 n=1 Tax=Halomarina ordinaria TaxID=3033939 RepID=A0ABD5U9D6_9EURY|nr:DUF99 family protein [Halomarina sp. PSRA2]
MDEEATVTVRGRALGIAESHAAGERSTVAGAVCRRDRVLDGLAYTTISIGGTDGTARYVDLWETLDREDVGYVLVAGVAPAWFNLVDLPRLAAAVERPVIGVSFEASPGLEDALRDAFDGDALDARLALYDRLPERRRVTLGEDTGDAGDAETLFVQSVGLDAEAAARVVRAYTPEGGRPEPLRVARLAARAAERFGRTDGL